MARDHVRMQVAMWDDEDWCALDVAAQHAYWLLTSNRGLSYCGVLDYLPGRLRGKARGLTGPKLHSAVKSLARARFVVVDDDTTELLIRSYVRHDGVLNRRNMGKAVGYAYGQIVSSALREAVRIELARLHHKAPDLAGWRGFEETDPDAYKAVLAIASAMESPMQSPIASAMESPMQSPMESVTGWGVE